jgi:hypothetical protein
MAIHVANFILVHIDSVTDEVFTKDTSAMKKFETQNLNKPTMRPRDFSTEHRVQPDTTIPNTAGHPTLKDYLELEATSGFKFKHLDQTYIITES